MNLHEFQAKEILQKYQIPVPPFKVISKLEELKGVSYETAVVKVQVHAGGRGKAGGVKFAKNRPEVEAFSKELLGMKVVNNQTGPLGLVSHQIMLTPPVSIKKEFYLAALIDRKAATATLLCSREGGVEIEEAKDFLKVPLRIDGKLKHYELLRITNYMGWKGALQKEGIHLLRQLAKAFTEIDALLLEINPLVETEEGKLFALDAKCVIDDNALYRQKELSSLFDKTQITNNEILARENDLAYVGLTGQIGCMVNGAGLAMATMDMIQTCGGSPANFLDVGGSATKEKIAYGFKIILMDPHVKAIFVNIFGGIMDCAVLATGIVEATKEDPLRVPLIVRMEGTNVEKGKEILKNSGLTILTAETMEEGAKMAVSAWQS